MYHGVVLGVAPVAKHPLHMLFPPEGSAKAIAVTCPLCTFRSSHVQVALSMSQTLTCPERSPDARPPFWLLSSSKIGAACPVRVALHLPSRPQTRMVLSYDAETATRCRLSPRTCETDPVCPAGHHALTQRPRMSKLNLYLAMIRGQHDSDICDPCCLPACWSKSTLHAN